MSLVPAGHGNSTFHHSNSGLDINGVHRYFKDMGMDAGCHCPIAQALPPRFASNLSGIRQDLPALFSGAIPFVLTLGDLYEVNILLNPYMY